MPNPLTILIVEDSEDDALLLLRELRRGGYEPSPMRVETAEDMRSALERQSWDLVVSDYILPRFGGLAALDVLKASGLDIPFIIVSGNIGEDIAVRAMKAGAQDYIIKGNLARLVPAVERELREAAIRRERRKAEDQLNQTRHRLFLTLENMSEGFFMLDREWRHAYVNAEAARVWGISRGQLTGRSIWDPSLRLAGTPFEEELRSAVEKRKPVNFEAVAPLNNRWMEVRAYPALDGLAVYFHDITERKEAEHRGEVTHALLKLYAGKFSLKEYLDAVCGLLREWSGMRHVGVRVARRTGELPFLAAIGYDEEFLEQEGEVALAGRDCICSRIVLGAPAPSDCLAMTAAGTFFTDDTLQFEERLSTDDRAKYRGACVNHGFRSLAVIPVRYGETTIGAVHLADERPGLLTKKKAEFLELTAFIIGEAVHRFGIEEQQMRLASAIESTADGVVITNPDSGIIEYVNEAFVHITGYTKEEALGRSLHFLDSGKYDRAFYEGLRATMQREGVWRGQIMNRKKDGTLYFEECSFSPVRDTAGNVINYVSVKRDVSEKLRLESIAESVNMMNNIGYVFAGVRHEIGNPINSAKMSLSVLLHKLDQASKETVHDYVVRSLGEIGRVEQLLKNLRNFTVFETPQCEDLQMNTFLDKLLALVGEDFTSKNGIKVSCSVLPGAEWAFADPRALQQVLLNLMTNAADALANRPSPAIAIVAGPHFGRIRIEVTDNGCGMNDKQLKDLFKPFYTSKAHGTGLGLVIVKKMLTLMNSEIEITSLPETGTTVTIYLPEGSHAT